MSAKDSSGSELRLRVISAVVIVSVSIIGVGAGGWVTAIFIAIIAGMMIWELSRLVPSMKGQKIVMPVGSLMLAAAGLLFIWFRELPNGLLIAIWVPLVTAMTDTGAYFAGRRFGKRKLAPVISPKKTIEGAMGGMLAAVLASLIFSVLTGSSVWLALLAVPVSIAAQFGDLSASWVKRQAGAKDAGTMIPGHGGFMDRFDGMMGATLLAGLLILIFAPLRGMWG